MEGSAHQTSQPVQTRTLRRVTVSQSKSIRVSFFSSDQDPRGQVEGKLLTFKEDDEHVECYGELEDGRYIEIVLKRRRKKAEPASEETEKVVELTEGEKELRQQLEARKRAEEE